MYDICTTSLKTYATPVRGRVAIEFCETREILGGAPYSRAMMPGA